MLSIIHYQFILNNVNQPYREVLLYILKIIILLHHPDTPALHTNLQCLAKKEHSVQDSSATLLGGVILLYAKTGYV